MLHGLKAGGAALKLRLRIQSSILAAPGHATMASWFQAAREFVTPVLKESRFPDEGVLTPEEFVRAGDFLVKRFPVWQWCVPRRSPLPRPRVADCLACRSGGEADAAKPFLPPDKQFLVCRGGSARFPPPRAPLAPASRAPARPSAERDPHHRAGVGCDHRRGRWRLDRGQE